MFSLPVSSGWKPVPTSSSEPTRPSVSPRPVGRRGDPRQDLQHRALAGAVAPDDADGLAGLDLERDVLQRPEVSLRAARACGRACEASPAMSSRSERYRPTPWVAPMR